MKFRLLLFSIFLFVGLNLIYAQEIQWYNSVTSVNDVVPTAQTYDENGNSYILMRTRGEYDITDQLGTETITVSGTKVLFAILKFNSSGELLARIYASASSGKFDGYSIISKGDKVYAFMTMQAGCDIVDADQDTVVYTKTGTSHEAIMVSCDTTCNNIQVKKLVTGDLPQRLYTARFNFDSTKIVTVGMIRGIAGSSLSSTFNDGTPIIVDASAETESLDNRYFATYDLNGDCNNVFSMYESVTSADYHGNTNQIPLILADQSNSLIISGVFSGSIIVSDYDATPFALTSDGVADSYLFKCDDNGNISWLRKIGGTGDDYIYDGAIDDSGNIYIGGYFNSTCAFESSAGGSVDLLSQGLDDACIVKYTSTGSCIWAKSVGTDTYSEQIFNIRIQNSKIYTAGNFSNNLVVNKDTLTGAGNLDGFLMIADTTGELYGARSYGGTSYDAWDPTSTRKFSAFYHKNNDIYFGFSFLSPSFDLDASTLNNGGANNNTVLIKNCPPIRFIGLDNYYCNGSTTSELTGYPDGGTFSGSGITGNTFNPNDVTAGTYPISYTYTSVPAGCATSYTTYVTVTETPEITGLNTEYCDEETAIALTATPLGGTFTVDDSSATEFDPVVLDPATYTVKYYYNEAGTACNDSAVVEVTVNPLPNVTFDPVGDICINEAKENLSAYVSPLGSDFSGDGITGYYFSPSVASIGDHTVVYSYTDANSCTDTAQRIITVNDTTGVQFSIIADACENHSSIDLTAYVSLLGGNFSGTGVSGNAFYPVLAGTGGSPYTITYIYENADLCKDTSEQTIVVNSIPSVTAGASSTSVAYGNQTILNASPLGGSGSSYTFDWSPADSLANAADSSFQTPTTQIMEWTTTYAVEVTDGNNCISNSDEITINVTGGPMFVEGVGDQICPGDTAQLDILITGGSGSFSFLWSPVDSLDDETIKSPQAIGLTATKTYSVTVTDLITLIEKSTTAEVTVLASPSLTVTPDSDICIGESITISASDGMSSYFWDNTLGTGANHTVSPVVTTLYHVTATAINGCTAIDSVEVSVNTLPVVVAGVNDPEICNGESTTLTETGAVSYVWTDGTNPVVDLNISPSNTTTYSVTGTDANGCQNSDNIQVIVNALPNVQASVSQSTICEGETVLLSVNGADSYVWTDGTNPVIDLNVTPEISTTYYVTGTDVNGCENTSQIFVTVNSNPIVTFSPVGTNEFCKDDPSISLTTYGTPSGGVFSGDGVVLLGGYRFYPNIPTTDIPFDFIYSYTDVNGCIGRDTQTVIVNSLPIIDFITVDPLCENASPVTLSATPGGGAFSGTGVTVDSFDPTVGGDGNTSISYTYTDPVTGCTNSSTQSVTVYPLPIVSTSADAAICPGETEVLSVTGTADTYVWDNGLGAGIAHAVIPAITTTYSVSGTDANGCVDTDIVEITVNPIPDALTASADITEMCIGDSPSPTLTASGADTYVWDNGLGAGDTKSVTPSVSTSYTVTGTNSFGCENTASVDITVNQLPIVTANSDISICDGSSTIISVSGDADSYSWDNGLGVGTSHSVSPIVETTYTVTGTSVAGCVNIDNITVSINALPTVSFSSLTDNPVCENSGTTERIDQLVSPLGGLFSGNGVVTSGSEVYFHPELATAAASPHTITYTYTDANGCANSATQSVVVNEVPIIAFTAVMPLCVDAEPVVLNATPAGGSYFGVGIIGSSFSPSTSGDGDIFVSYTYTDGNGCTNTESQDITVNPLPTIVFGTINDLCINSNPIDLSGTAVPTGGTYTGTGIDVVTSSFDPAIAGVNTSPGHIISYTYTDANGCTNSEESLALVKDLADIVWSTSIPTSVCVNDDPVVLDVTPAGGTFSGIGVIGNTFYPSIAGAGSSNIITYNYTDINGTGCSTRSTYIINVNDIPEVTASADQQICEGISTSISVIGTALSYTWDNGLGTATSVDVAPSVTTTYSVVGTDANGCSISDEVIVSVNPMPTIFASNDVSVCNGETANISVSGTATTYTWDNGLGDGASFTVSPTQTTTYTVIGSDALGCSATDEVIVSINSSPFISASTNNPEFCIGGTALLNANGAVSYVWDNNLGSGATKSVNPQTSTTYTVIGTDASGCEGTASVTLNVNPLPIVSAGEDIALCKGDTAILSATGDAVSYTWNNGLGDGADQQVNPITTTIYTVTATDALGCTSSDAITVTVYNKPTVTITSSTESVCVGSSAVLTAQGAISYIWDNNLGNTASVSVSPQIETAYSVTGTDSRGCSNVATKTISIRAIPVVSISATDSVICKGDIISLTAQGAYSYVWDNSLSPLETNQVAPTQTTTYHVTGTNSQGCTASAELAIEVNQLPVATASAVSSTINYGSYADLLGFASGSQAGEYSYKWTPAESLSVADTIQNPRTIGMSTSQVFGLVVTDAAGCESNESSIIINVQGGALSIIPIGDEVCAGEDADLNVLVSGGSGGFRYAWSHAGILNDTTIANPTAVSLSETTDYTVTVTDTMTNDSRTAVVSVLVNSLPTVMASEDTVVCANSLVEMSVSGDALNYTWSNGLGYGDSKTVTITDITYYFVSGIDSNACTNVDTINIYTYNTPEQPQIVTEGDIPFCIGDSIKLLVPSTEGITYEWSNGTVADSIYVSTTGQFTVQAISDNGCVSSASDIVTTYYNSRPSQPTIISQGSTSICYGESVSLQAPAGYTYLWSNDSVSQTIEVQNAGDYNLIIFDANGCASDTSEPVTVEILASPERPVLSESGLIDVCMGASQTLTATTGYQYLWSTGDTTQSITVSDSGEYFVQVAESGSCYSEESDTAIITYYEIETTTSADTTVCFGADLSLNASGGDSYEWSIGQTGANVSVIARETEYLYVTVSQGECVATDSISITVIPGVYAYLGEDTSICTGEFIFLGTVTGESIEWSTGDATESIYVQPTQTTTYSVSVTSGECVAVDEIVVSVIPNPVVELGPDTSICEGTAYALYAGDAEQYMWSTGETTQSIIVEESGNYVVSVSNGGCEQFDNVQISVVPNPVLTMIGVDATCGESNGLAQVEATGSNLQYRWQSIPETNLEGRTDINTSTLNNVPSGYYAVAVNDGMCYSYGEVIVNDSVSHSPISAINASKETVCRGEEVMLTVVGTAYSMLWYPDNMVEPDAGDTVFVHPTTTTTYYVIAASGACQTTESITINVDQPPLLDIVSTATYCEGESVSVEAGDYESYLWSTGSNTRSISVDQAGMYTVTVTEGECSVSDTVIVSAIASPIVTIVENDANCGMADGSVIASVAGNADDFTFLWNNGVENDTLSNITAGVYTVQVSNGECSVTETARISNVGGPEVNITASSANILSGEFVTLTASGADSYEWELTSDMTVNSVSEVVVRPTETTTYSVIGTFNGCSTIAEITINVTSDLVVNLGDDITVCEGETVTLSADIDGEYMWNNGSTSQTITVTESGTYSVTVSQNLATGVDFIQVTILPLPEVAISVTQPTCGNADGEITASNVSGYSYTWSNGGSVATIGDIASGYYAVTVSNGACFSDYEVFVSDSETEPLEFTAENTSICDGEEITITCTEAEEVSWHSEQSIITTDFNSALVTPNVTTTYYGSITTSQGCVRTGEITIEVNEYPISELPETATICSGGETQLNAGPYAEIYSWSNGSSSQSTLISEAGTYTVSLTSNGCTTEDQVVVSEIAGPEALFSLTNPTCGMSDGAIELSVVGGDDGYSYTWLTNPVRSGATISDIEAGNYSVEIQDAQCSIVLDVMLADAGAPVVSINPSAETICEGESVVAVASGAMEYTWYTESGSYVASGRELSITPQASETYIAEGVVNGCNGYAQFKLTVNETPVLSFVNLPDVICANAGAIILNAQPAGGTFKVGNTSTLVLDPANITSRATVQYSYINPISGCSNTISQTVDKISAPEVAITNASTAICDFDDLRLYGSPTGGAFYINGVPRSSFDPATVTGNEEDFEVEYRLVDNSTGCTGIAVTDFVKYDAPVADFSFYPSNGLIGFVNQSRNATAYSWNFAGEETSTLENPEYTFTQNRSYTVTLTVSNPGCESSPTNKSIPVSTAIDEDGNVSVVSVSPNPTTGQFAVNLNSDFTGEVSIEISSVNGTVIEEQTVDKIESTLSHQFDISGEAQGVYILKVVAGDVIMVNRIILK